MNGKPRGWVMHPRRFRNQLADLAGVLDLLDAATAPAEICEACGCLCTPYERCPGCLAAVLRPTDPRADRHGSITARRSA